MRSGWRRERGLYVANNGGRVKRRGLFLYRPGVLDLTTSASDVRTYIDADGAIRLAASGVARDADYSTGERGLLVESERTNLFLRSDPAKADLVVSGFANDVAGGVLSPFGFARGIDLPDTSGATAFGYVTTAAMAAASSYAMSGFFRAHDDGPLTLSGSGARQGSLNLRAVSVTGVYQSTRILASALYRISAIWDESSGGGASGGSARPTSAIGVGYAYSGLQLELGLFPSSYIPTAGAAATRAADAIVAAGVLPAGIHATRYERYFDLATGEVVEQVVDVESTEADVVLADDTVTDRVWYALAYDSGEKTLEEMKQLL